MGLRTAQRNLRPVIGLAALFGLAGNITLYASALVHYSHVYDAMTLAIFLWAMIGASKDPASWWRWAVAGTALAISAMHRLPNVVFGLVPIVIALGSRDLAVKSRIARAALTLALGALGVMATLSIYNLFWLSQRSDKTTARWPCHYFPSLFLLRATSSTVPPVLFKINCTSGWSSTNFASSSTLASVGRGAVTRGGTILAVPPGGASSESSASTGAASPTPASGNRKEHSITCNRHSRS